MAKEVLVIAHNHFDPTWRRCFDRLAKNQGVAVRSYAEVEQAVIDAWLKLARSRYSFSEGQAVVWRRYLSAHASARSQLRNLARKGQLDIMLAGETVQDTNLPTAEGLIRNFLVARPFYADWPGSGHRGLKLGWLEDAFGNSANYPQVLRGVGAEVACALSYRKCPDRVWVGIDGTKIPVLDGYAQVFHGDFQKHAPCGSCHGRGCRQCRRTGMDLLVGFGAEKVRATLETAVKRAEDWVVAHFGTEEVLPDPSLPAILRELNRKYAGKCRLQMANYSDIWARLQPALAKEVAQRDDRPTIDLNPAMPGVMVSRIRCKQLTRAVAYELQVAEAALATRNWQRGKAIKMPPALTAAWQKVVFTQFHDAITGTHIDAAYEELMDLLGAARAAARPYLPRSTSSASKIRWKSVRQPGHVKMGHLDVHYDLQGLVQVTQQGTDVFGTCPHYSTRHRPLRIGELVLEADFGDAWGQRIADFPDPSRNASQIALGDYHLRMAIAPKALRWQGKYQGPDPKVRKLAWTVTVRASEDGRRLNFTVEVDWDTASRRLRVMVPVQSQDPTATYEIPFGFLDRKWDPAQLNYTQWKSWTGEWPTLHWARQSIDQKSGVAILNRGLPCYRWQPGRFDLSLLRSPEWEFCAVESGSYEFWDIDGQRDAGRHRLEFSLWPYYDGLGAADLTRAGYDYNLPAPIDPPFAVQGDVVVTAWKPAEDGQAWILRLQEAAGAESVVRLVFPTRRRVSCADLLEDPQGKETTTANFVTTMHRHQILTLRIS